MSKKSDYYNLTLSVTLKKRIMDLFKEFPSVSKEYQKGKNPGIVKFIEEAIRLHIERKEQQELEKMRMKNPD